MSELGSQIIFKDLLARHQRVQVPMIQRDYAQGRESEREVRDEFLSALHAALTLPEDDATLPLNLDFIYGSVEGDGATRFLPLDGQQRLTTLFLLHWYLAWRDGCCNEFNQLLCAGGLSRFTYSVRPSSSEFFDALVKFEPDISPDTTDSLTDLLTDQPWYFRNWRLDPTIQASLNMLDAIHLRFKDSSGLFARIINVEQPAITFQLLDLKNFGLSDDLYIKMNSRGKPLTPFETFKARYEQRLSDMFEGETRKLGEQDVSVEEFFSNRMDTQWTDFFWPHRDENNNVFDEAIMNLFRTLILLTRSPDSDSFVEDVTSLRNKAQKNTYSFFSQSDWLDRSFSEALILLLETWSKGGTGLKTQLLNNKYFDEENVFLKAITEPTSFDYEDIVQFAGYVLFLKENHGSVDVQKFQEWTRIIFNLSVNTVYNRPLDLQRSIDGLKQLIPYSETILEHFATTEKPVSGFNADQIIEERAKAQLIINQPDWRSLIDRAEGHGYFRGQIGFLLDFCGALSTATINAVADWDNETHTQIQSKYSGFLQQAEVMFSSKGLQDLPDFKWERALLSVGDYLLPSRSNYSFLVNSQTDNASWKRLLRDSGNQRSSLCALWSRLNGIQDISMQLDMVIGEANQLEPWREAFVRTPIAIRYCLRRLIRWISNDEIYLLQTTQMNGTHAELFTYCLYHKINTQNYRKHFKYIGYPRIIGSDTLPSIVLNSQYGDNELRFDIEYKNGMYDLYIQASQIVIHPSVEAALIDIGFTKSVVYFRKLVSPDAVSSAIIELGESIANIPVTEAHDE